MNPENRDRPSLRDFDAYADQNGQHAGQDANDVANPAETQRRFASDPSGQAEMARLASSRNQRFDNQGATDETEAETPAENIRHISDPSLSSGPEAKPQPGGPTVQAQEAIDRATAAVGVDEDNRR